MGYDELHDTRNFGRHPLQASASAWNNDPGIVPEVRSIEFGTVDVEHLVPINERVGAVDYRAPHCAFREHALMSDVVSDIGWCAHDDARETVEGLVAIFLAELFNDVPLALHLEMLACGTLSCVQAPPDLGEREHVEAHHYGFAACASADDTDVNGHVTCTPDCLAEGGPDATVTGQFAGVHGGDSGLDGLLYTGSIWL